MKALLQLNGKYVKTLYDIKSVKFDNKYNYWIVTQHIYKHDLTTIHKVSDVDKIIVVDKDGVRKEIER